MKKTTAMFPGSFNPFHAGHANIIVQAAPLFDRIIIAVGQNEAKTNAPIPAIVSNQLKKIMCFPFLPPWLSVECYQGLLIDNLEGIDVLIRGLRDEKDFLYEQKLFSKFSHLSKVPVVFFMADEALRNVSSTALRNALDKKVKA